MSEATHIVHWPGKDVLACDEHTEQLKKMGNILGTPISATPRAGGVCANCESDKEFPNQ